MVYDPFPDFIDNDMDWGDFFDAADANELQVSAACFMAQSNEELAKQVTAEEALLMRELQGQRDPIRAMMLALLIIRDLRGGVST